MTAAQRQAIVVAILITVGQPASAQQAAWPGFRGPGRDGVAAGAKPPLTWSSDKNVKWRVDLPGPGSSSPIVVGDRVIVTCYTGYGKYLDDGGDPEKLEHHLVCYSSKTGKELWRRSISGPLEKKAPQVQLTEHGFASPTPITDGSRIYCYFGRAGVVATDLEGKLLWRSDVGNPSPDAAPPTNSVSRNGRRMPLRWGAAASPLLYEDLVIVNASEESNAIQAFDKRTGKVVWKHESANLEGCATSPMLAGKGAGRVLVMVLAGSVWGLDPATGKELWSEETSTRGGMSPTPVADGTLVYCFGGDGKSLALRLGASVPGTGSASRPASRVAWKSENLGIPSPVLHDGRLLLVSMRGIGKCVKAADGEVLFKGRLEGRTGGLYASPVLADGRLYVVTRKRGTFVYSADGKFKLLARNELDDRSQFNASPAVVGKELFLRSDKRLYCITAP